MVSEAPLLTTNCQGTVGTLDGSVRSVAISAGGGGQHAVDG